MTAQLPTIHVSRPDGGYEMRAMSAQDVLAYIQAGQPLLEDLLVIVQNAIESYNAKTSGQQIDVVVRNIEALADAAEQAKLNL